MSTEVAPDPVSVALYMRASTELQKYSVSQQATLLTTYAAARGYLIQKSYVDDGRSGLTLAERPGLQALLADVVDGTPGFSRVLVLDVSRWGRFQDPDEAAHYEYLCQEGGVTVDYCHEAFENGPGAMASLVKSIKRIMAAEFSRELSQKVQFAQCHHARGGFKMGGQTRFGFRRALLRDGRQVRILRPGERKSLTGDKVRYVHGPEREHKLIREIFRLFVMEDLTYEAIAERLGSRGGCGKWTMYRVRSVLLNELVTGVYAFNKVTRPLKGQRRRNSEDAIVRAEVLPAIVSPTMFARAQDVRRQRARQHRDRDEMLYDLKALLSSHGYLTHALIRSRFGDAGLAAMRKKFGSVAQASQMAGYAWYGANPVRLTDGGEFEIKRASRISDEELLTALRELLAREGRLSAELIRKDRRCPDASTYRDRFGSLRSAYALAGYALSDAEHRSRATARYWRSDAAKPRRRREMRAS